ncbi:MAG: 30S ribosomal protein S16 [Candidatus Taylorbacteria bacterium RIFOXYD2_FULL_36_9]|uniref:Small ribosomal subunit protein bS16 n=1 Tax=Candidatus Taylorbacteria bacterium RIFOXYD2_FULL_36_9 TaxID=1802338 RepID=A0A1G2PE03_9BACT|nr:MAG: 30S ribosomal protein S16 [Candidatus Taylorbacteria bacterium RIFOXYD2_FULL_36_9]
MLMIRLQRVGRVHEPTFRVVLVDSKKGPKSGQALEILGNHDTRKAKNNSNVDVDRIKYWISKGAQLSDTMRNLLITKKIITGKKVNALPKKRPIKSEVKEGDKKTVEIPKTEETSVAEIPKVG